MIVNKNNFKKIEFFFQRFSIRWYKKNVIIENRSYFKILKKNYSCTKSLLLQIYILNFTCNFVNFDKSLFWLFLIFSKIMSKKKKPMSLTWKRKSWQKNQLLGWVSTREKFREERDCEKRGEVITFTIFIDGTMTCITSSVGKIKMLIRLWTGFDFTQISLFIKIQI